MQYILHKDTIEREILPHLPPSSRGYKSRVASWQIVQAILYKLKTGCQWRCLPVAQFIECRLYRWQTVYYYFRRWGRAIECLWHKLLDKYRRYVDLSSANLDGSHTPSKRGGDSVGYQGRKRCKTTNLLLLSDSQGLPLACSRAISGEHNDLFDVCRHFQDICYSLSAANIQTEGLFINADSGFDAKDFSEFCFCRDIYLNCRQNKRNSKLDSASLPEGTFYFDDELYHNRFVIERSNAWLDSFKNLLVRFDTKADSWRNWHFLAFVVILLNFVDKKKD